MGLIGNFSNCDSENFLMMLDACSFENSLHMLDKNMSIILSSIWFKFFSIHLLNPLTGFLLLKDMWNVNLFELLNTL